MDTFKIVEDILESIITYAFANSLLDTVIIYRIVRVYVCKIGYTYTCAKSDYRMQNIFAEYSEDQCKKFNMASQPANAPILKVE